MAKKLYTESYIEDIADAIREKNGSSATYTTAQMGNAIRAIQTQSSVVNGIIESYKSSAGTIDANTFVQFVNTRLADGGAEAGENQLLSSTGISGSSVSSYYRDSITATLLSDNSVFLTYRGGSSTGLYGVVCTISGTTITPGTPANIAYITVYGARAVKIDTDTVFIIANTSSNVYGYVCTISGTTFTRSANQILFTGSTGPDAGVVKLDTNTVLAIYSSQSNYTLLGVVCTVSGTTITVGTEVQLAADVGGTALAVCLIDSATAYVTYSLSGGIYGIMCAISGATITPGTKVQLVEVSSPRVRSVFMTAPDEILVHFNRNNRNFIVGVSYGGDSPDIGEPQEFLTYNDYCSCVIPTNSAFAYIFFHNSGDGYKVYGTSLEGGRTINSSTTKIDGLTRTGATTSTAGDVWVLNA